MLDRKEYFKKHNKEYHQKNKDRIRERKKIYYENNKEMIMVYRKKHADKFANLAKALRVKNITSWHGYIPMETSCQICGKVLYFNRRDPKTAIHFDHRVENVPIKMNPTHWLISRYRNEENQRIWESCDFGILCRKCNAHLPTKNREAYLKNVIKYVFGERSVIANGNTAKA